MFANISQGEEIKLVLCRWNLLNVCGVAQAETNTMLSKTDQESLLKTQFFIVTFYDFLTKN